MKTTLTGGALILIHRMLTAALDTARPTTQGGAQYELNVRIIVSANEITQLEQAVEALKQAEV